MVKPFLSAMSITGKICLNKMFCYVYCAGVVNLKKTPVSVRKFKEKDICELTAIVPVCCMQKFNMIGLSIKEICMNLYKF